jgi:hypothetical protein
MNGRIVERAPRLGDDLRRATRRRHVRHAPASEPPERQPADAVVVPVDPHGLATAALAEVRARYDATRMVRAAPDVLM